MGPKRYQFSASWGDMVSDEYRLQKALLEEEYADEIEWMDYALDLQSGLFDEEIEVILKSK